jgi:virginiamycin B lyase
MNMSRWQAVALASTAGLAFGAGLQAQQSGSGDPRLEEWTVPYPESRPRDPFVGSDGRVWFVGQAAHYAAVLDPATGEFTRYDMDPGTGPHTLIVDDDGLVYYAGNRANHIGIIDPETGTI